MNQKEVEFSFLSVALVLLSEVRMVMELSQYAGLVRAIFTFKKLFKLSKQLISIAYSQCHGCCRVVMRAEQ